MRQQLYLGTAPADVELPQHISTYKICSLWRDDLRTAWEANKACPMPTKCKLIIQAQGHELGDYYEVVMVFDDDDTAASDAAFWLEANSPINWTVKSLRSFQEIVSPI